MIRTHDRGSGPGSKATLPSEPATLGRDFAPNLALPWVVRLRYGIACGVTAIILGMAFVFHLTAPLLWMFAILSVVVGTNLLLSKKPQVSTRFPQATLGAIFVLDTLCLTVMLGLTGGSTNPFSLLYLVQITLSAITPKQAATNSPRTRLRSGRVEKRRSTNWQPSIPMAIQFASGFGRTWK